MLITAKKVPKKNSYPLPVKWVPACVALLIPANGSSILLRIQTDWQAEIKNWG